MYYFCTFMQYAIAEQRVFKRNLGYRNKITENLSITINITFDATKWSEQ